MRGINLSPKTPPSQIALCKVPCQRKQPELVMKGGRAEGGWGFNGVKVLEAKSF